MPMASSPVHEAATSAEMDVGCQPIVGMEVAEFRAVLEALPGPQLQVLLPMAGLPALPVDRLDLASMGTAEFPDDRCRGGSCERVEGKHWFGARLPHCSRQHRNTECNAA